MSDFYTEQLVKKQSGAKEMAIRAGLIVLTVIARVYRAYVSVRDHSADTGCCAGCIHVPQAECGV